jgi:hypothetical protein
LKAQPICIAYQTELFDVALHRNQGLGTGIAD